MKLKLFFLWLLAFAVFGLHAQNSKLRIAIFDPTSSGSNIDEGTRIAVREIISSVFVNTGDYMIVERSLLEKVMSEQMFTNSGAVDDSQASEIGRLAGANKVVLSVIILTGQRYMLSIKLVDVNTAGVEKQKTQVIAVNELFENSELLAMELIGVNATAPDDKSQPAGQRADNTQQPPASQPVNSARQQPADMEIFRIDHAAEREMVFVEGGVFVMGCLGSLGNECAKDELPAHEVTLNSYFIGKFAVTQKQWELIMGTTFNQQLTKSNPDWPALIRDKGDNFPMYYVKWEDAQEFVRRLNLVTRKNYRLPTEAEWEYAARGGGKSQQYRHSGSHTVSDVAWYRSNSGSKVHPVGTKAPNELGIYDMNGNVWEWCSDWYGAYSVSPEDNPQGASAGANRVSRGGSMTDAERRSQVTSRGNLNPDRGSYIIGFRLAHPLQLNDE